MEMSREGEWYQPSLPGREFANEGNGVVTTSLTGHPRILFREYTCYHSKPSCSLLAKRAKGQMSYKNKRKEMLWTKNERPIGANLFTDVHPQNLQVGTGARKNLRIDDQWRRRWTHWAGVYTRGAGMATRSINTSEPRAESFRFRYRKATTGNPTTATRFTKCVAAFKDRTIPHTEERVYVIRFLTFSLTLRFHNARLYEYSILM